jgi:hypothetical protein
MPSFVEVVVKFPDPEKFGNLGEHHENAIDESLCRTARSLDYSSCDAERLKKT